MSLDTAPLLREVLQRYQSWPEQSRLVFTACAASIALPAVVVSVHAIVRLANRSSGDSSSSSSLGAASGPTGAPDALVVDATQQPPLQRRASHGSSMIALALQHGSGVGTVGGGGGTMGGPSDSGDDGSPSLDSAAAAMMMMEASGTRTPGRPRSPPPPTPPTPPKHATAVPEHMAAMASASPMSLGAPMASAATPGSSASSGGASSVPAPASSVAAGGGVLAGTHHRAPPSPSLPPVHQQQQQSTLGAAVATAAERSSSAISLGGGTATPPSSGAGGGGSGSLVIELTQLRHEETNLRRALVEALGNVGRLSADVERMQRDQAQNTAGYLATEAKLREEIAAQRRDLDEWAQYGSSIQQIVTTLTTERDQLYQDLLQERRARANDREGVRARLRTLVDELE